MADFMIRFLICNVYISGIIGILLVFKRLFKNNLSGRMQYNLWFLMIGMLAIPFIPLRPIGFPQIFSWLEYLSYSSNTNEEAVKEIHLVTHSTSASSWLNDFTISVSSKAPSATGLILWGAWITGILVMIILLINSSLRLRTIKKSALPLQNPKVRNLYNDCLRKAGITKDIPVYSTAFLKSPIIVGFVKPAIYLPIYLISDCTPTEQSHPLQECTDYEATHKHTGSDIRYMLLHELQHYRHRDTLINYLANLAGVLYWFNPFVWYALKEMRNDREIACDTSVLNILEESEYQNYGNTLINMAEKISFVPFPFATGIGGNMKQIKRRIMNIASYEKPTLGRRIKGCTVFGSISIILLILSPALSTYAADDSHYNWNFSSENVSYVNLGKYFGKLDGSFVLYDLHNEAWSIHNIDHATLRVSPDSTYKIYDALFALEAGVITPENSLIAWDGSIYPFKEWNANQTLESAMQSSVNWYFQTIDQEIGLDFVYNYIHEIGYGNEAIGNDLSAYWLESSLKISTIEQVELLTRLYNNSFDFAQENVDTVKDSIRLTSGKMGTLYGKTGTGRVDDRDINGWFIGYIEAGDNTYFFATNIAAAEGATGSRATDITMSILSDMNIWE